LIPFGTSSLLGYVLKDKAIRPIMSGVL